MSEPRDAAAPPLLPPLRDVIARYGLSARKSLGQHFLLDLNLTRRIARAAGDLTGATVIEVGPGPGGLTRALLESGARQVIAIEMDQRCTPALEDLAAAYEGRLGLLQADALDLSLGGLGEPPRRVVANLPYNLASVLTAAWMADIEESPRAFAGLTLMYQKEVATRLAAGPGNRDYGRLSVLVQWLCRVEPLFDVAPRAFTPPPRVTSTVVSLTPRPAPLAPAAKQSLERVTAAAFGQRRKMLRQSLRTLGGDPLPLLEAAGIPETARAEQLEVEQLCALARAHDALRED